MSVRYLGGCAVLVKSFARIHETNLKKQGVLALTFTQPSDYDRIQDGDQMTLQGLTQFAPKKPLTLLVRHRDGKEETLSVSHSFTLEQIAWFRAGSALNRLRENQTAA